MAKSWDVMTANEKIEVLGQTMAQIHAAQNALTSDLDSTWDALRAIRSELDRFSNEVGTLSAIRSNVGKLTKEVATLRSLWPKSYARTG
jgi:hypothetical protein